MSKVDVIEHLEWAYATCENRELFGRLPLDAAHARERRAMGAMSGAIEEITRLKAELAAEMAVVDWYADGRSWHSIDDLYFYNRRDIVDKSDVDLTRPFNAGKRARARQAERTKE